MIDPQLRGERTAPVTNRVLRQFAALWLLLFGALAYLRGFGEGNTIAGYMLATLASIGLAGMLLPVVIRPVFFLATTITRPIGWVVSHLILFVIFFAIFTPVAVLFRLMGRDALSRQFRPDLDTYWVPKAMNTDARSYMRLS